MIQLKVLRTAFQIIAFGIFVYQMKNSVRKYFDRPTMKQTSIKSFEEIEGPVLFVCREGQYKHEKAKQSGYDYMTTALTGKLTNSGNITWKGKFGNITDFQHDFFHYDPNNNNATIVKFDDKGPSTEKLKNYEEVFILPYGVCKKFDNMIDKMNINSVHPTILLHVDPSKTNRIRVIEIDNAKFEFGPNRNNTFDATQYLLQVRIYDQSIQDGITCTNYKSKKTNYGECIEKSMKKEIIETYNCLPPWFPNSTGSICEKDKDVQIEKKHFASLTTEITSLIKGLDMEILSTCLPPCITLSITVKKLLHAYKRDYGYVGLNIAKKVTVHTDVFAYDVFSLIVDLGSALGLWLGLSAVSILDITLALAQYGLEFKNNL